MSLGIDNKMGNGIDDEKIPHKYPILENENNK